MAFPGTYNFNYYRGDTFEFTIYPKNADGSSIDLEPYSVFFAIAPTAGASNPVVAYTEKIGNSGILCVIRPEDSDFLLENSYVYDVQIGKYELGEDKYERVYTLLAGTISITNQVGDPEIIPTGSEDES